MDEHSAHYTVLARRFRPQSFGDVVGQEHVAQALRNAITSERVAHAYLFTGARGVGKTSTARILAKSLNCPNAVAGDPCNDCEVCESIASGSDVDVLEIDGASNRGIDDIRSLRANVNIKSMRSRFKIYIIDEVHMLTKEAFNALLKTLEEPPPSVKFIFCTTEPNKLPDTILSRCQRFDFGTIQTQSIGARLAQIAEAEGKQVAPEAIELIARRAAGSMRDSQSLFDQLLAFGSDEITAQDVHQLLGTAGDERLAQIVDALIAGDRAGVLTSLSGALADGIQLGELVDQLLGYLRDLMVTASGATNVSLMGVAESSRPKVAEQAQAWGLQTIVAAMQLLAETKERMQRVTYGRALTELALIRISLLEDLSQIDALVQVIQEGGSFPVAPAAPASQATRRSADAVSQTAPPQANSPQKKTAEPLEPVVSEAPAEPKPESVIDFCESNTNAIWSQVIKQIDDRISEQLRNIQHVAISGPNQLAVSFPRQYTFSKQYCERPEVSTQLSAVAGRVTGRSVVVTFRIDDAQELLGSTAEPAPAPKSTVRRPLEAGNDPLVNQAISIFGASIAKVETIAEGNPRKE